MSDGTYELDPDWRARHWNREERVKDRFDGHERRLNERGVTVTRHNEPRSLHMKFHLPDGRVLNWWPATGTVLFNGNKGAGGKRKGWAAVIRLLDSLLSQRLPS